MLAVFVAPLIFAIDYACVCVEELIYNLYTACAKKTHVYVRLGLYSASVERRKIAKAPMSDWSMREEEGIILTKERERT